MALFTIPTTGLWSVVAGYLNSNFDPLQIIIDSMGTKAAIGNTVKVNGTIPIVLAGTGDPENPPPSNPQPIVGGDYAGYVEVTGLQEIAASGALTVVNSEIVVGVGGAGNYHTPQAWIDMSANTNAAVVGYIFAVERAGFYTFSQRVVSNRASAQDLQTNISGGGFLDGVQEGDKISMWVASNLSTTITLYDLNIGLLMDRPAALGAL